MSNFGFEFFLFEEFCRFSKAIQCDRTETVFYSMDVLFLNVFRDAEEG